MCKIERYLNLAAQKAWKDDARSFYLGAVGIRYDGAIVWARNQAKQMISPDYHAEARLVKMLDVGSVVFVARIRLDINEWANARPCRICRQKLKSRGVRFVYYTIGPGEWGKLDLNKFQNDKKPMGVRLPRFSKGRWNRGES